MSAADLIAPLAKLTLSPRQAVKAEIDDFLHAQDHSTNDSLPTKLKSVACIVSNGQVLLKSHSGWSAGNGNWYGHKVLLVSEMILRTKRFAREIKFTFNSDTFKDGLDMGAYWSGRFQACHAEVQLIVQYCFDRSEVEGNSESQPGSRLDDRIEIHVYPREVCRHCHDFAKWVFMMNGLHVNFYFEGKRDYPRCSNCKRYIKKGHICEVTECTTLELDRCMDHVQRATDEYQRCQENIGEVLKSLEQLVETDEYNSDSVRRLLSKAQRLKRRNHDWLHSLDLYLGAAVRLIRLNRIRF